MSELKKAKYFGGIGASLEVLAMIFPSIAGCKSLEYCSHQETKIFFALAFLGFIFLLLSIIKIAKISGGKGIFWNFLWGIGIFILILPVDTFLRIIVRKIEKRIPYPPSPVRGGVILEIAQIPRIVLLLNLLIKLLNGAIFLVGCFFLFRSFKKVAKLVKSRLFLASSVIVFLFTPLLLIADIIGIIEKILFDMFFFHPYPPFFVPFLFWAFGFFLLVIAFFTLPEDLPSKSLTEKKEV